mmetsp:Transcript_14374/g.33230  ORF Transcript_14374/g.33230 Transcript_14374/m.33230 type:complete len:286 (+) Transcript_14374:190-1047(+)
MVSGLGVRGSDRHLLHLHRHAHRLHRGGRHLHRHRLHLHRHPEAGRLLIHVRGHLRGHVRRLGVRGGLGRLLGLTREALVDKEVSNLHERPGEEASEDAVRDRVRQRHQRDGDESRDRLAEVVPVDIDEAAHHHGPDDDQRRAGRPRGHGGEEGSEEDRDEEVQGDDNRSEARAPTLGNAGGRLDVGGDGGGAEACADGGRHAVDEEGGAVALEVALFIHDFRKLRHRKERASGVEKVDVKEREQSHEHLPALAAVEAKVHLERRGRHRLHAHHLLEVLVAVLAA